MGTRGPKPKNRRIRVVGRNVGVPPCPAWLSPVAKTEYRRVAGLLEKSQLLQKVDLAHLVMYASAWADFQKLTRDIAKEGSTLTGSRGQVVVNPKLKARQIASNQVTISASKLGLSPNDRERLTIPDQAKPDDPIDAFLNG